MIKKDSLDDHGLMYVKAPLESTHRRQKFMDSIMARNQGQQKPALGHGENKLEDSMTVPKIKAITIIIKTSYSTRILLQREFAGRHRHLNSKLITGVNTAEVQL